MSSVRTSDSVAPRPEGALGAELVDTRGRVLPLRETRLTGEAGQGFARLQLVQRFENVHDEPLEVTYRMPLPPEGAVSGYAFAVDGREVRGVVQPKALARATYEAALAGGHTAGLLEEERANLFTQRLGNLPPRSTLVATIAVDMPLNWLPEGAWELRFPTVIGARYVRASDAHTAQADAVRVGVSPHALAVRVHAGLLIRDQIHDGRRPESPSHAIESEPALKAAEVASYRAAARAEGTAVRFVDEAGARLDRDLVVRWPVATAAIGLSLASARPATGHPHAEHAYGVLTLVPPLPSANARALARDLTVLIDTSGSMGGLPLETAKIAVGLLLESLGAEDRFELVEFNSMQRAFRPTLVPATAAEKRAANRWVRGLVAGGATEMHAAVLAAMSALRPGSQRQVVLVTDGYIGGEEIIVRTLLETMPSSCRLHFLGVGSAVNRALALAMARAGRGVECVVSQGDDPERALGRLLRGTTAPVLTNVALSGDALGERAPALLPDVFAGSPLRAAVQLSPAGGLLRLRGETAAGASWEHTLEVPATAPGEGAPGLVALFARERVADLETQAAGGEGGRALDQQIQDLGVDFQISTRLTSWVAVDARVSTEPGTRTRAESVPQEVPHGARIEGFGLRAALAGGPQDDDDAVYSLASLGVSAPSVAFGAAPQGSVSSTSSAYAPPESLARARGSAAGGTPFGSPMAPASASPRRRSRLLLLFWLALFVGLALAIAYLATRR